MELKMDGVQPDDSATELVSWMCYLFLTVGDLPERIVTAFARRLFARRANYENA